MSKEVKRVPIDFDWPMNRVWLGYCLTTNSSEEDYERYEKIVGWEKAIPKVEPPTGEAWQMWETVSEGSPISPPCESAESLARWLVDNKAYAGGGGDGTATYDEWMAMIRAGWCITSVFDPQHGFMGGVQYCKIQEDQEAPDA